MKTRSDKKAVTLKCKHCSSEFECKLSRLRAGGGKYCSQSCRSKHKSGTRSPFFKGKPWINANGYLEYTDPLGSGKKFLVHRTKMEESIGRKLKSCEVVHHIDNNKLNNDIANLEIMLVSEHVKHHNQKLKSWAKKYDCCTRCETTLKPHQAKGLCVVCYKHLWFSRNYESLK